MTNRLRLGNTLPRGAQGASKSSPLYRAAVFIHIDAVVWFGELHMKKVIVSLAAASIALVSVQAFAQASEAAPAAAASAPKKHHIKQLKTHGKKAHVSAEASAAGTNDKGTQN